MKSQQFRVAAAPRLIILGVALVALGCASKGRPIVSRDEGYAGSRESREVQLTVENQNFKDATIYAVWGAGNRDHLGLVTGKTTQMFTFPWQGSDLRIEVDFIAGDDTLTEPMGVGRGDHLHVTIPPGA